MDKNEAKERIAKLKKEIEHHRYLYHVLDVQEISDAALDSLKHELYQLEELFPQFLTPDSPTQRVSGKPLDKFNKVKHSQPTISLEDVFSIKELEAWEERNRKLVEDQGFDYFCELKLDGLTVVLTYEDGIFRRGATRGDGQVGEEVTQNLKTIEAIPLKLSQGKTNFKIPKVFEVRGEVVMTKKVFQEINNEQEKKGLPLFANPRNVAAGSIRQLDPGVAATRKLGCFVFEIITDIGQKTHEQVHQILKDLGFKTNPYSKYCKNFKEVNGYLNKWIEKRLKLDYQTDGVVVVVNNVALERKLGSKGKAERWMAAYKFPAEQATTQVIDIQVQVGRTGTLTPVAVLKPVLVAGSTVSRATLHNQDEIERLDVRIGDTVIIQKAGDIIPDIVRALPKLRSGREKKFIMPKKCPICDSRVIKPTGEVNYYCSNKSCFAVEKERLVHFVSKKAFNIDGLGPKIIEQLINKGLVSTAGDLFILTEGDLEPLERFAEKSAHNLVSSIQSAKKIELERFIYALGIRHVGEETAIELARHFGSLEKLKSATLSELESIRDIGCVVAKSFFDYFQEKENMKFLDDLEKAGVTTTNTQILNKFANKIFVLTGSLASLTRDQAKEKIRSLGGKIASSVSKKTDFVVKGEDPGSKYNQAKNLGVKIISEKEFINFIK